MKHFILLVFFWSSVTILTAQSVVERVTEIRRAYADAQTMMLHAIEEPNLDNSMHIKIRRMFGGSGMQEYTVDYFCGDFSEEDEEEAEGVSTWSPYFIRVKYNWAARVTVREYLIEPRTSTLMFAYTKSDDHPLDISQESMGEYELRKYYYSDGTFCTGTMKVTLPDGSEKSLDEELNVHLHPFDSDTGEIDFVRYLLTIQNQMMNHDL